MSGESSEPESSGSSVDSALDPEWLPSKAKVKKPKNTIKNAKESVAETHESSSDAFSDNSDFDSGPDQTAVPDDRYRIEWVSILMIL